MTKRVLIFGLKEPAGGVESAVMNYVRFFDHTKLVCDLVIFGDDFSMRSEIEAMGGKVICLPNRRKHFFDYKAALRQIFEEEIYCAVWCNFSGLTNMDIPKLAKKKGVPIIVAHSHTSMLAWGSPVMKYVVHVMHYYNKTKIEQYFTDFFTCTQKSAVFMFGEEYADKARLVPNAVDTQKFRRNADMREKLRKEFGISESQLVIGHVGRMCVAKNQLFMLDIFKKFREAHPDAVLLFVGDGELKESVLAHAEKIGVAQSVVFTGSRGDVNHLLSAMDVFLLPSVTEGLPVTVVEAQSASLPCVVSSQAVPAEIDLAGHVYFVSLEDDVCKWVSTLEKASHDAYEDGYEIVSRSQYDIRRASKELENYFIEGSI